MEPIKLPDGREALVPLEIYKAIEREIHEMPEGISPESADAAINNWNSDDPWDTEAPEQPDFPKRTVD